MARRKSSHVFPNRQRVALMAGLGGVAHLTNQTSSKELTDKYIAEFCRINHLTPNNKPLTNKEI